jgi:hypothetical protein
MKRIQVIGRGRAQRRRKEVKQADDQADAPEWWTNNLSLVQAWSLPAGKNFFKYFNMRDTRL